MAQILQNERERDEKAYRLKRKKSAKVNIMLVL